MASSQDKPIEFPSWCPNFNSKNSETKHYSDFSGFRAGYVNEKSRQSKVQVSHEGKEIRVSGFRVDIVKRVAQKRLQLYRDASIPHEVEAANLEWDAECLQIFQDASMSTVAIPEASEIYTRTLMAEHFDTGVPLSAHSSVHRSYLHLKGSWQATAYSEAADHDTLLGNYLATLSPEDEQGRLRYAISLAWHASRRYFNTEGGRVGVGPSRVQPGDRICAFYSAGPLFIVRFDETGQRCQLIGDAYVHGLMDLRIMPSEARGKDEIFTII
jgi:hypothetical protein